MYKRVQKLWQHPLTHTTTVSVVLISVFAAVLHGLKVAPAVLVIVPACAARVVYCSVTGALMEAKLHCRICCPFTAVNLQLPPAGGLVSVGLDRRVGTGFPAYAFSTVPLEGVRVSVQVIREPLPALRGLPLIVMLRVAAQASGWG